MEKCLVTKLLGSSSNTALLKIGEMRIKFDKVESPSKVTQVFYLETSEETALEIIGDGYFTDETLSENKGKRILVKSPFSNLFVSNSSVEIAVLNKYALIKIRGTKVNTFESNYKNKEFSLSNVKFSARLIDINFPQSGVYGDLSDLQRLTTLQYVHLNSTQIYGDISSLKNLTGLSELNLSNTQIYGDISSLKNLTGLTYINLSKSSKLSLYLVGGYGILAVPTKSAVLSCQSGYGRNAIPSYRLPLIYKDKYEHILMLYTQ